jgi:hypothetical protein
VYKSKAQQIPYLQDSDVIGYTEGKYVGQQRGGHGRQQGVHGEDAVTSNNSLKFLTKHTVGAVQTLLIKLIPYIRQLNLQKYNSNFNRSIFYRSATIRTNADQWLMRRRFI